MRRLRKSRAIVIAYAEMKGLSREQAAFELAAGGLLIPLFFLIAALAIVAGGF